MEDSTKICEAEMRMLKYFWKEKGDVRRYTRWENIQEDLAKEHPALHYAFKQLHTMEEVIDSLLKEYD